MTPTQPPQCSIALWRGYVTAQFYARDSNGGGILFVSPSFRTWRLPWQRSIPLQEDARALAAFEALDAQLRARDWVRLRREPGADWYAASFRLGHAGGPRRPAEAIRSSGRS